MRSRNRQYASNVTGGSVVVVAAIACLFAVGCGDDDGQQNNNQNGNSNNAICGNGSVEIGEECDEGTQNSDSAADACRSSCRFAYCGDGAVDSAEQCENDDLNGATCSTLDASFTGGTLSCSPGCELDTAECSTCGNGLLETGEACDGILLGTSSCLTETGLQQGVVTCSPGCDVNTSDCHTCGNSTAEGPETCDDGNATPWDGCNECSVVEFQVNTYESNSQTSPDVAISPVGFVIVWHSNWQAGGTAYTDIYGQRYDAQGLPLGAEFLVNLHHTLERQDAPRVAMADDGSFVVVWRSRYQDGDGWGVYGQRFDASGTPDATSFQVSTGTASDQTHPGVAMAADGRFMVVFVGPGDGSAGGIFGRRYDAAGSPEAPEFQINTYTTSTQNSCKVSMAADGRAVVVWTSVGQIDGYDVFGQRFDAAGSPVGTEFQINDTTTLEQTWPQPAVADDGTFTVVWTSETAAAGLDVHYRRFDSNATPLSGADIRANTSNGDDQSSPDISIAPDGRFIIVWTSANQDGSGGGVYAQRHSAQGSQAGTEFLVHQFTTDDQGSPAVAVGLDGRFVIAWSSSGQDAETAGIFGQKHDPAGIPVGLNPW